MKDGKESNSVEQLSDNSKGEADATRGITRFAQYTAPVMLAMLASGGKDMALAQGSIT